MSTSPALTCATNDVCSVRNDCDGSPSSSAMARSASAVTIPPCGNGKRFHTSSMRPS
jgi:hypothetical protein